MFGNQYQEYSFIASRHENSIHVECLQRASRKTFHCWLVPWLGNKNLPSFALSWSLFSNDVYASWGTQEKISVEWYVYLLQIEMTAELKINQFFRSWKIVLVGVCKYRRLLCLITLCLCVFSVLKFYLYFTVWQHHCSSKESNIHWNRFFHG